MKIKFDQFYDEQFEIVIHLFLLKQYSEWCWSVHKLKKKTLLLSNELEFLSEEVSQSKEISYFKDY
jgi:hypothetical protein